MKHAKAILNWYDENRRDLPWRAKPGEKPDPYRVWMSEIMLQQTTVQTVKDYFHRFLGRWPDIKAMAASEVDEILSEWAGLGYYARARNMHKCAKTIVADHDGKFPQETATLQNLPGIGDYTANAIAAIAFNRPATVIDGNIERIVTRLFQISDIATKAKPTIKSHTATIGPNTKEARHGDYAQAMMDLGATICRPKNPSCGVCPCQEYCNAFKAGDMERYPVKAPKQLKPTRQCIGFIAVYDGQILLEKRKDSGLLGGTLGIPTTDFATISPQQAAADESEATPPIEADWTEIDKTSRHTFTHFHLETQIKVSQLANKPNLLNDQNGPFTKLIWLPIDSIDKIPTVFRKMAKLGLKELSKVP